MEKFRRDINTVFSRQQSGLGHTAGVSDRLLQRALAPIPARRHLAPQLAAALATLLLGAALAYVAVVTRGHLKSQGPVTRVTATASASASPSLAPTPSPTRLTQPLSVPAATPVILYFDPANQDQVDGVTWDGSQRGRLGGLGGAVSLSQNPSGTLYSTFREIYDRAGKAVAPMNLGNTKGFTWADDGQHYCQIVSGSPIPPPGGEPGTLRVVTISGSVRNVAQVGVMGDQFGSGVAACSFERDRAVVTRATSIGTGTQTWVVKLSTGRILWTKSGNFIASSDGQYLAEGDPNGGSWTVYGPTFGVVGHIAGPVQGLSRDGSLMVVGQYGARPSVIDWRTGRMVWMAPEGTVYTGSLPEPGGARIAVEVQTPGHPQTGGYPTVDVYAVSPDGKAVQILANVSL